jgi:CDP-diglyceride synthetase
MKQPYTGFWYDTAEILNLIILLLSFTCVFLFKKRMLQFRMANILAFLNVCLLAVLLFTQTALVDDFLGGTKHTLWPSYLPIIAMIFAYLAGVFIKKDENLVRSTDRIR